MINTFSEIKLFQVKPDKRDQFEELIKTVAGEQTVISKKERS